MSSKGNDKPKASDADPRFTEEEKRLMKSFGSAAMPYIYGGYIFNIIFIALVLLHIIDFSKLDKTEDKHLSDLQSRVGYTLKYSTPGLLFIFFCIRWVIYRRIRSPAMDPLNNQEVYVLKAKNILTNTVEQFLMSITAQLILVTHMDAEHTHRYIPALSFLFVFGRITYLIGYPQYRSFGMITTMFPTMVVIVYDSYKFFSLFI